jgi:hypothetical protein
LALPTNAPTYPPLESTQPEHQELAIRADATSPAKPPARSFVMAASCSGVQTDVAANTESVAPDTMTANTAVATARMYFLIALISFLQWLNS